MVQVLAGVALHELVAVLLVERLAHDAGAVVEPLQVHVQLQVVVGRAGGGGVAAGAAAAAAEAVAAGPGRGRGGCVALAGNCQIKMSINPQSIISFFTDSFKVKLCKRKKKIYQ